MGLKIARWGGRAMMSKPYSLGTRAGAKFINFFHPGQCWLTMPAPVAMVTPIQTMIGDVRAGFVWSLIDANGDQVSLVAFIFWFSPSAVLPPCLHFCPGMFIVLYLEGDPRAAIFSVTRCSRNYVGQELTDVSQALLMWLWRLNKPIDSSDSPPR